LRPNEHEPCRTPDLDSGGEFSGVATGCPAITVREFTQCGGLQQIKWGIGNTQWVNTHMRRDLQTLRRDWR
jgi:hypothetical protein